MTLLAALAALEQELRALSASQFRSMEKADVADKSGTADAYEMAAESNLASANKLAALRVRFEGGGPDPGAGEGDVMSEQITRRHCVGCRDDFYNHNRMGLNESSGEPRCWSAADARLVKAKDVPRDMRPPYTGIPLTEKPNCYYSPGYVRVKPEALTADGYWR